MWIHLPPFFEEKKQENVQEIRMKGKIEYYKVRKEENIMLLLVLWCVCECIFIIIKIVLIT